MSEVNQMKKLVLSIIATLVAVGTACAGQAKVTWKEPDTYTDIREGNETRDAFRQTLFSDLELLFADLAKQFPDGYVFDVTVTDVDLAGEVNGMHSFMWRDIRVVEAIYWPRMSLSYTLKDSNQQVLTSGNENIKDIGFLTGLSRSGLTRFSYEETMLREWFKRMERDGKFPIKGAQN
jgi:hypothetical protein